ITVAIGIIVSIALLFYALRDVSVAELLEHLRAANLWYLPAATTVATLTFHFRAIRWRALLLPTGEEPPFSSRYAAVSIGFMVNNVIGGRVGEFARAYALSRIEPIGVSAALASLVVERLLDALVLLALLIPAILLGAGDVAVSDAVRQIFHVLAVLVSVGLVTLGVLVRFPKRPLRFAEHWLHKLGPDRLADRVTGILEAFVGGLGALRHGHVFARALAWSVVVWGFNGFSFYLGFLAFDIVEPGIPGALLLQTIVGAAVALPSTPGFFGPFEFGARLALELYSTEPSLIISFAASYHISTFMPITLIGIWYMRRLGFSRGELGKSAELTQADVDHDREGADDPVSADAPGRERAAPDDVP
ncbi:MAG: flippase-like domain-containing protein, partial [Gemmatimonadetes bacterium]|nr:flippase-like domain-containing protein [Gemmatimonadota bacterium]